MIVATMADWLDRLEGVRKAGSGYKARCPAHDDKQPIAVRGTEGDGGKVLVTLLCGLHVRGHPRRAMASGRQHRHEDARRRRATARGLLPLPKAAREPRKLPDGPHDTVSLYHHADGSVAFASVRRQPPGKAKRFSQWTPADGGLWYDRNPLEVAAPLPPAADHECAKKVVVVEGEKCVHAVLDAWPDMAVTTFGRR